MLYDYSRIQARRKPHAPAITMNQCSYTYHELEYHSNQLAEMLLNHGLRLGDRVCLFTEKHPNVIIAMLGILKAGGIYVPLDIHSPANRVAKMIIAACPTFILIDSVSLPGYTRLKQANHDLSDAPVIWWSNIDYHPTFDEFSPLFTLTDTMLSGLAPEHAVCRNPESAAHILFTSGSTGQPKGVVIKHSNVCAFIDWAVPYFSMNPDDRNSGHSPLHFDLSTFDIYGTFASGAHLFPVPANMSINPSGLASLIQNNKLSQWFSVPSALHYLARFKAIPPEGFPSLKRLIWCGEVFPLPGLTYWMHHLPHVQFTNLYGPTETTIASCYHTLSELPTTDIPIGQACPGEQVYILDQNLQEVDSGNIGELYITGAGLSPGYWVSPLLEDRWVKRDSPFIWFETHDGDVQRIYKTGDLASKQHDGLLYFHGRTDYQIKSRGYRIELGEIEAALHSYEAIREFAVVPVQKGGFEGTAIGCAFVLSDTVNLDNRRIETDLKNRLQQLIPPYMIPHVWMEYPLLPRNANGKIDRKKLSETFESSIMAHK